MTNVKVATDCKEIREQIRKDNKMTFPRFGGHNKRMVK